MSILIVDKFLHQEILKSAALKDGKWQKIKRRYIKVPLIGEAKQGLLLTSFTVWNQKENGYNEEVTNTT